MCKYQGEHPFVEINTTLLWGLKEILSLKDSPSLPLSAG